MDLFKACLRFVDGLLPVSFHITVLLCKCVSCIQVLFIIETPVLGPILMTSFNLITCVKILSSIRTHSDVLGTRAPTYFLEG